MVQRNSFYHWNITVVYLLNITGFVSGMRGESAELKKSTACGIMSSCIVNMSCIYYQEQNDMYVYTV